MLAAQLAGQAAVVWGSLMLLSVLLLCGVHLWWRRQLVLLGLAATVAGCSAVESAWMHCDQGGRGISDWQKRCEAFRRG